jgi:hypothetical protein
MLTLSIDNHIKASEIVCRTFHSDSKNASHRPTSSQITTQNNQQVRQMKSTIFDYLIFKVSRIPATLKFKNDNLNMHNNVIKSNFR